MYLLRKAMMSTCTTMQVVCVRETNKYDSHLEGAIKVH